MPSPTATTEAVTKRLCSLVLKSALASKTSLNRRWSLNDLPDDLILLILEFVEVMDIIRLRQTSKRMYRLSKLRWVWSTAIRRLMMERRLTIPALDLDINAFSANHFETRAVHAVKFHENWHSERPTPKRKIKVQLKPKPGETYSTVRKVFFLPGKKGEILVTVTQRSIACWEVPLGGSEGFLLAEVVAPGDIQDAVVNEDPNHDTQIVLSYAGSDPESTDRILIALHLDEFHGKLVTLHKSVVPFVVGCSLYALHGRWLACGKWPSALDIEHRCQQVMGLCQLDTEKVLTVKFVDGCLLIITSKHAYITTIHEDEKLGTYSVKCAFLAEFSYSVRDAAVWVQKPLRQTNRKVNIPEMVSIVLRCDDGGFETLKQLDCLRNPHGTVDGHVGAFSPLFSPACTRTIMISPSSCNFVVGTHGKGVFFETKTITTSSRTSYTARCLGGFELRRSDEEFDMVYQANIVGPKHSYRLSYQPPQFVECKREVYSRRCDMGEIMYRRFSLASVALEDAVGRIAIGDRNGMLEILDYA